MRSRSSVSRSSTALMVPPIGSRRSSPTLSVTAGGRLFRMRARRVLPVMAVLAVVAFGATGCFESQMADTTISGEITVGEGSTAQTVTPSTAGGSATTTQAGSTEQTQSTG